MKQEVKCALSCRLREGEGERRWRWGFIFDSRELREILLKPSIFPTEWETKPEEEQVAVGRWMVVGMVVGRA